MATGARGTASKVRAYLTSSDGRTLKQYDRSKRFAESCMAEYDLEGWTAKDLVTPRPIGALR